MIEGTDKQTGVPLSFLFYGTLVSDKAKPKDVAIYAVKDHMERILVREKGEFDKRFDNK